MAREYKVSLEVAGKDSKVAERELKERMDAMLFDFSLGTHPISTKGTSEIGGAKRRSDFDFYFSLPGFSMLIFSLQGFLYKTFLISR